MIANGSRGPGLCEAPQSLGWDLGMLRVVMASGLEVLSLSSEALDEQVAGQGQSAVRTLKLGPWPPAACGFPRESWFLGPNSI